MAISFGETFLYSHNPEKLYHFLSFLLDVQAHEYNEHQIKFKFQTMVFVIRPCGTKKISRQSYFSLQVDNWEELYDLKRTIEFYYYKEGDKKYSLVDLVDGLEFTDPDNRKWSAQVKNSMHHHDSSLKTSTQTNVRNF